MTSLTTRDDILRDMDVAKSLKRFRRAFGLSQQNIADAYGIIQQSYSAYESKRGVIPTVSIIFFLAKYYNVSTDYLLGLIDEPRPLEKSKTTTEAVYIENLYEQINSLHREIEALKQSLIRQNIKVE